MKHFCYGLNDFSDSSEEIDGFEGAKEHKQTVKHNKPLHSNTNNKSPKWATEPFSNCSVAHSELNSLLQMFYFFSTVPFLSIN